MNMVLVNTIIVRLVSQIVLLQQIRQVPHRRACVNFSNPRPAKIFGASLLPKILRARRDQNKLVKVVITLFAKVFCHKKKIPDSFVFLFQIFRFDKYAPFSESETAGAGPSRRAELSPNGVKIDVPIPFALGSQNLTAFVVSSMNEWHPCFKNTFSDQSCTVQRCTFYGTRRRSSSLTLLTSLICRRLSLLEALRHLEVR